MSADAIQLEQWHLQFHELMAATLRVTATIRREAGIWGIAPRLWGAGRDLKRLVQLEGHLFKAPDGAIDEAHIKQIAESTDELVRSIENLIDTARSKGLLNRTLTAGSLDAIRKRGEELAEYLDAFQLSVDPELAAQIEAGRADFAEGQGIPLDLSPRR